MKTICITLAIATLAIFCAMSQAATPSISFTSPNGGEVYIVGQTQFVKVAGRYKSALIEISLDGGNTFTTLGTISTANQGQMSFVVNQAPSTSCVMRVTAQVTARTTAQAQSGAFCIVNSLGGTATTTNVVGVPDGSVTNPKLAAGAVTTDKMSSGSASNGMVLSADGAGNVSFNMLDASHISGKIAAAATADTATTAGSATTAGTATTAANFSGALAGDVTGGQNTTSVVKLRGTPLSAAAPADGQLLRFNATSGQWEPATLNNGLITSISGTNNEINVVNNNGAVTISTPQGIAPASSPTFAGITSNLATFNGNTNGSTMNSVNAGSGPAASFTTAGQTAVSVNGGNGPLDVATVEITGNTADGLHSLTLGQSRSGIFAEARQNDSYGLYAISFGTMGQGSGVVSVGYSRDSYALQAYNQSTAAGGGGGMLVDQEGTTNNIAVFQSSKTTRAVIDNSGKGSFSKLQTGSATISSGFGNPNSALIGNVGDLFLQTNGGTGSTLWVKESASGTNTGWVAK